MLITTKPTGPEVTPRIEENPPPVPVQVRPKWPPHPKVEYRFDLIPKGKAARIPRAAGTVKKRMYQYLKTDDGRGKKFLVRPITKTVCRIWRIE